VQGNSNTAGIVGLTQHGTINNCLNVGQVYVAGALTENYPILGWDADGASTLTNKNITNIAVTNDWIQRYVAPQAVYAIDLIGYVDETSNNDFWFGITSGDKSSTYVRSMISLCDLLTGGGSRQ
jgi:hypothetical protein